MAGGKKRKPVATKELVESSGKKLCLQAFFSSEAMTKYRSITKRKVILERGIENKGPFAGYIEKFGWQTLCASPCHPNMNMANEFYANLQFRDGDGFVLCRGKKVKLTAEGINDFYGLSSDPDLYTEWRKLKRSVGVNHAGHLVGNWEEIVRTVTQSEIGIEEILPRENWGSIPKKFLNMDMNVWYSFVAARLLPVSINSEVQWERLRMLYALKNNIAIDVGSEILAAMLVMFPTTTGLGFHSLITSLCHKAGCMDSLDDTFKKPMGILTYEAFNIRSNKEPVSKVDDGTASRLARMESELAYIRRFCEHTGKIIAHNFPASIQEYGPYPEPPVHAKPPTVADKKEDLSEGPDKEDDEQEDDEKTP